MPATTQPSMTRYIGAGQYAAYAHLRRGSVLVRPGDRVYRGQIIAECGNSGNTSEPHLHFQLMDRRRPALAAGVPDDQIIDVGDPG